MKKTIDRITEYWNERDLGLYFSIIVTLLFVAYNAYIGLRQKAIWNGSISVYYILLSVIKIVGFSEYKISQKSNRRYSLKVFVIIGILTLFITVVMIVPAVLMIEHQRKVTLSIVFGITVATFTTYKVVVAIKNCVGLKNKDGLFERETVTVNLVSALISVLTLQNTLISVNGGETDEKMITLSIVTSIATLIAMSVITAVSLAKGIKSEKIQKQSTELS